MADTALRVLLADDHPLVREGLRRLIDAQPDMHVVAEADNGLEAVRVAHELAPDVAVVDISMPGLDGYGVAKALRDRPEIHVLGLTRHDDRGFIDRMIEVGAMGYVLKQSPSVVLIDAIRTVGRGGRFFDPHVAPGGKRTLPAPEAVPVATTPLTHDEERVLRLIADGHSQTEVAQQLCLARETADALKESGMRKLNLTGRVGLVRHAEACGWIRNDEPLPGKPAGS
jgi:two-component system, NarL family, response regulator NreC